MLDMILLVENVQVIDFKETFESFNGVIFYFLIAVLGIGVLRFISRGFSFEIIIYVIVSGFAIFLVMNPDKLMFIGETCYNITIAILNSIYKVKKSMPDSNSEGTKLLIGCGFNIFANLNPEPKTIEEAEKNQKNLEKNVVKKQNSNQRKTVKKGWF
jgi:hypothetical protein